ncbi:Histone-fold containing protein [Glarea lozoyensis ATCC 20868]|uniref:Histone-fold containing protein n=1 Tax=Glarea lozoyensis (strain ATCC 20868 / MF5171) TaxID=1116229 RepID=S3CYA7_GLAL2|nr:Histone-fold containing protein [Glarea lozoyensis ATCC 20868]EPE29949.1 Histone-fold containing protein [Glarea lozoyensis ATCC 20868]
MDVALQEQLKAALWFSIGKIVDEETLRLNTSATPQFIGALTEMVWTQIENVAIDLESFAYHAGRTAVTTDDVLLLTRRNDALQGIIRDFIEKGRDKGGRGGKGKGKGKEAVGRGKGKGVAKGNGGGKGRDKGKGRAVG